MKKNVIFILILLFVIEQNNIYALYQNTENIGVEEKKLSKREERKLKKQREKEEKEISEDTLNVQKDSNSVEQNENIDTSLNNIEQNENKIEKQNSDNLDKTEYNNENNITENLDNNSNSTSQESTESNHILLWIIIILLIPLLIVRYMYKRKCNRCEKWNSMRIINRECVDEKPTTIVETRTKKNSKNEVISSWEVDVPATVYYYHTHRKCKHCGYKDYLTSSKTLKN